MFDSGLRLAKVVRVYPGGHSVDVVMYDDASPQTNVQVLSGYASTNCGISGMIKPEEPPDGEWGVQDAEKRNMIAVIGYVMGCPVAVGFLFPQVNQMTFDPEDDDAHENRLVFRHPSDLYATITKNADFELCHPSGTFIRMATEVEHEDLTEKDFDKKWKIEENLDKKVHIHIEMADKKAVINIDPDGNIDVTNDGNITIKTKGKLDATVTGDINVKTSGAANVESSGDTAIKAPMIILDGNVQVNGSLTSGMASGGGVTMNGPLHVINDVTAGNGSVSLLQHVHNCPGGLTSPPVPGGG